MSAWWLGLPPAQTVVACGEHAHRLRWEAGVLRAIDHDDPEAERALAALGGQRCTCVEVLDAWARHASDPRVLVLASRGPADPIAAQADWTAQIGVFPRAAAPATATATAPPSRIMPRQLLRRPGRWRATAPPAPARVGSPVAVPVPFATLGRIPLKSAAESELVALLGLGGGIQDRLVATVAAAWAPRFAQADAELSRARPALHATMQGRLAAAVRTWLGRVDVDVELDLIEERRTPTLSETAGVIRAELPFAWLAEVWSRGLTIVLGRFCLAARTEDGRAWTLATVGPDLGPVAPVTIELPGSGPQAA